MAELLLYMSELLLLDNDQSQYTPYFYDAGSVLTDGDPRHGIQDDHVPFMTRGHHCCICHLICNERRSGAYRRNGSTCVEDLVEDCKKATSIYFLCRNKVKLKQRKQNSYNNVNSSCSIALITNYKLCIKLPRRRPARSPSLARTASAADSGTLF